MRRLVWFVIPIFLIVGCAIKDAAAPSLPGRAPEAAEPTEESQSTPGSDSPSSDSLTSAQSGIYMNVTFSRRHPDGTQRVDPGSVSRIPLPDTSYHLELVFPRGYDVTRKRVTVESNTWRFAVNSGATKDSSVGTSYLFAIQAVGTPATGTILVHVDGIKRPDGSTPETIQFELEVSDAPDLQVTAPQVVAEVVAEPDLRIDVQNLWVDWAPDGRRLAYIAKGRKAILLDLEQPSQPQQLTNLPAHSPRFSPDGKQIAFVGSRQEPGRSVDTVYLQHLDGGAPADLLPGDLAVQSVSTAKYLQRWLDADTLAYEEHMGTGVQRLFLLDIANRRPTTDPELLATLFHWDPAGERVAGQWTCCPARFWIWDRQQARFLKPEPARQGPEQWFESWSPDGGQALFTEWDGKAYDAGATATLYRRDMTTGAQEKVADNAALGAWSGTLMAYVELGQAMTLVVADAIDGRILWTDDLGPLPARFDVHHWAYRPVLVGDHVAYRTSTGEWRASPGKQKRVHTIRQGEGIAIVWSLDGRHAAVLDETGRLLVLERGF